MRAHPAAAAAVAIALLLPGCGSDDTDRLAAFCEAWGGDGDQLQELVRTAPPDIEDAVGPYVARATGGEPTDEYRRLIDEWVEERCPVS